jgi:hypothetical protein
MLTFNDNCNKMKEIILFSPLLTLVAAAGE